MIFLDLLVKRVGNIPDRAARIGLFPPVTCLSFFTVRCEKEANCPHFTQMACTFETSSAIAHRAGIGPKGTPLKSMSNPAIMTRTPLLAS